MINIITGRPGSGKTYVLTRIGLDYLRKGEQVWSNYKINWEGKNLHYWLNTSDLVKVYNGIILMDEAHVYFNSRNWENLSLDMQRKLQQHRKEGLHIWGTAQHEARIDVVFRELVSSFFHCEKIVGSRENSKHPWGIIGVSQFFPEDMKRDRKKAFSFKMYLIRKKFCQAYDTLAKIELSEKDDFYPAYVQICPTCNHKKYHTA